MTREKKLAKNTFIITLGNMCTRLITFFLLPLYTSLLSTSEYGIVDLMNTLVSLLLPIVTFQIEQATFRFLIDNREKNYEIKKIVSNSTVFVIIQSVIYLLVFYIISNFINNDYKYFLAINVVAYIFTSLFLQIARGVGDNKKYAFGSFVSAFFTIAFNIIFLVVCDWKVNGMLLGTFFGQIIGGIYLFISLKLYKQIKLFNKNKQDAIYAERSRRQDEKGHKETMQLFYSSYTKCYILVDF